MILKKSSAAVIALGALTFGSVEARAAIYEVTATSLNVRSGPGTSYSIVGTLANGTRVNVVGTSGDWRKIDSPKAGWCNGAYLKAVATSSNIIPTASTPFVWPATGQIWGIWDSPRADGPHHAIDICNSQYPPIYAARGGSLATQAYQSGYGNYVRVNHAGGYSTVYAHMSAFFGALRSVVRGEKIGTMGKSGAANGVVHCHWEIWRYGVRIFCPAFNGQDTKAGGAINWTFAGL